MTIYVLSGFNNYYNRQVKKFNTINEYEPYILHTQQNFNFVPNDNVNTQIVLGNLGNQYTGEGDYLLVINEFNEIVSRWFIIESVRDRAGQYTLTLHRDLVVDHYDELLDAPMFIEKATLPYESPLLFNEENITVNQIKTAEMPIMDKSKTPWLIGYYSKGKTLEGTVATNDNNNAIELNAQNIESWNYYPLSTGSELIGPASYGVYRFSYFTGLVNHDITAVEVNQFNGSIHMTGGSIIQGAVQLAGVGVSGNDIKAGFVNYGLNNLDPTPYSNAVSSSDVQELLSYNGKLVKTLDGKYYTITVNSVSKTNTIEIQSGALFNDLSSIVKNIGMLGTPDAKTFKYKFTSLYYTIKIKEETSLATTYNITANKLITADAPWDIFAIPLNPIKVIKEDNTSFTTIGNISIATAMAIQVQQASNVYDIQLLPYCPVYELLSDDNEITLTDSKQYSFVLDMDSNAVGVILNVPKSKFYFDIFDIENEKFKPAPTSIERKLRNECDKWRLTSPNYSNYFDFSVEKNDGITYFSVDCEYKPFTPYIHVNPNFSNLYGYDDNSPRGLVLGGDFSLSQIINQWEQYQIQNKNFQNIFDRQIQNMEVQHKYQRIQEGISGVAGIISGVTSGALAGSVIMPGIGALAGGISGGVASLGGMIGDIVINEKLRSEALDYTKDMFGYQLGNIQALPNTISKVSSLNPNNKIFPIIEYYTCTDEEKNAFINKIAYNGMTVMRIGTMNEFIGNTWSYDDIESKGYIKGKLIRIETVEDDYHIINALAGELNKGVYI